MKYIVATTALTLSLRFAVALVGAGLAMWAVADETEPRPATETAKPSGESKLICKQEAVMGSNIKRKTCKTQKQADEEREASQGAMGDLNRQQGRGAGAS